MLQPQSTLDNVAGILADETIAIREQAMSASMKNDVIEFKRERIIKEAIPLFAEHGFKNVSIEMLAAHLKVTKPFFYTYFESKQTLLEAIYGRIRSDIVLVIEKIFASNIETPDMLFQVVKAYSIEILRNNEIAVILFNEEVNLPEEARLRWRDDYIFIDRTLADLLQRGADQGFFNVTDPLLTSRAISGMTRWAHRWLDQAGDHSVEHMADTFAHLALNSVTVMPGKRPAAKRTKAPARPKRTQP